MVVVDIAGVAARTCCVSGRVQCNRIPGRSLAAVEERGMVTGREIREAQGPPPDYCAMSGRGRDRRARPGINR